MPGEVLCRLQQLDIGKIAAIIGEEKDYGSPVSIYAKVIETPNATIEGIRYKDRASSQKPIITLDDKTFLQCVYDLVTNGAGFITINSSGFVEWIIRKEINGRPNHSKKPPADVGQIEEQIAGWRAGKKSRLKTHIPQPKIRLPAKSSKQEIAAKKSPTKKESGRRRCFCREGFYARKKDCWRLSSNLSAQKKYCLPNICLSLWRHCPLCIIEGRAGQMSPAETVIHQNGICLFHNEHGLVGRNFSPLPVSQELASLIMGKKYIAEKGITFPEESVLETKSESVKEPEVLVELPAIPDPVVAEPTLPPEKSEAILPILSEILEKEPISDPPIETSPAGEGNNQADSAANEMAASVISPEKDDFGPIGPHTESDPVEDLKKPPETLPIAREDAVLDVKTEPIKIMPPTGEEREGKEKMKKIDESKLTSDEKKLIRDISRHPRREKISPELAKGLYAIKTINGLTDSAVMKIIGRSFVFTKKILALGEAQKPTKREKEPLEKKKAEPEKEPMSANSDLDPEMMAFFQKMSRAKRLEAGYRELLAEVTAGCEQDIAQAKREIENLQSFIQGKAIWLKNLENMAKDLDR